MGENMKNKVALVTGGARGLGKSIVLELAKQGYSVVVNYNSSKEKAEQLKLELDNMNVKNLIVKCDISLEAEVKNMVETVINTFGKIDVLVNNAAVSIDKMFYDRTVNDFKTTLNTNVIGTFLVSKYVGETMYNNKSGKIINLSSTNGINTYYPMCIDYDASKAAIISLTHNLATQFSPYVIVNAVAPGFIATESEVEGMTEEFIKLEEQKIMVNRVGTPQDVANLISFLASDKANFINNTVIKIDGGIYGD